MTDVFISYSTANAEEATKLRDHIESTGLKCWMAPRDIPAGSEYGAEIIKGIENTKVFLLFLSKESNASQHVSREVERAVNKKIPLITYQYEEVELTKSLEYFLASTQWVKKEEKHTYDVLANAIKAIATTSDSSQLATSENASASSDEKVKNSKKVILPVCIIAILFLLCIAGIFYFGKPKSSDLVSSGTNVIAPEISIGDSFSFGSMEYSIGQEAFTWTIIAIDPDNNTALCIADNIIRFQSYDAAESGKRGVINDSYYDENSLAQYSNEELISFWGNSDWATSNIHTWLNSSLATVTYQDQAPIDDATTIYENGYNQRAGFLYKFTLEEQSKLIAKEITYKDAEGKEKTSLDKVFLLSKDEVDSYLLNQNMEISATPTNGAQAEEGSGIYLSYKDDQKPKTYWALRDCGNVPACTILCAGIGMDHTEMYESEYACDSLLGIRPAIVLPLDYLAEIERNK